MFHKSTTLKNRYPNYLCHDDDIGLRRTTPDDLPFVVSTESNPSNATFIKQWNRDTHLQSLGNCDILHLIIESIEQPRKLGFIILRGITIGGSKIELKRIAVTTKGQGIGKKAIKLVKEYVFRQLNRRGLWLEVVIDNHVAKCLYRSEGFKTDTQHIDLEQPARFQKLDVMTLEAEKYFQMESCS